MHIAIVHFRLMQVGGLETRLFNYIRQFRLMGHRVSLIVSKIDPSIQVDADVTIHQINLKRVPKPVRMYFFDRGATRIFNEQSFDVTLSLGRTSNNDLLICPGTHRGYLKAIGQWLPTPIDLLLSYLDQNGYASSGTILAASNMMKIEVEQYYGINPNKVKVLWPPIDTERFRPASPENRSQLRAQFGLDAHRPVALFLTTGNNRKGYPFLLELFKNLGTDVQLLIAGVKPMGDPMPNVTYVGYVKDVAPLHQLADVLLSPALYEPFGQVVAESLLCGTPVLVSNRVGAHDLITDNCGAVLPFQDKQAWSAAIMHWATAKKRVDIGDELRVKLSLKHHCQTMLGLAAQGNSTLLNDPG